MKADKQRIPIGSRLATEPILFGGYDPVTHALRLTVEAASLAEARRRLSAVAPLVEIREVEKLTVLVMQRPSRKVPLFMQGFFGATGLGTRRVSQAAAQCVEQ